MTVESFFVINEHKVDILLEFIDLLQDERKRDNMVYTGSFDTESCLLPLESCVNFLLYPVEDHFAEESGIRRPAPEARYPPFGTFVPSPKKTAYFIIYLREKEGNKDDDGDKGR